MTRFPVRVKMTERFRVVKRDGLLRTQPVLHPLIATSEIRISGNRVAPISHDPRFDFGRGKPDKVGYLRCSNNLSYGGV